MLKKIPMKVRFIFFVLPLIVGFGMFQVICSFCDFEYAFVA